MKEGLSAKRPGRRGTMKPRSLLMLVATALVALGPLVGTVGMLCPLVPARFPRRATHPLPLKTL